MQMKTEITFLQISKNMMDDLGLLFGLRLSFLFLSYFS